MGRTVQMDCKQQVTLKFEGSVLHHWFYVVEVGDACILGFDVLATLKATLQPVGLRLLMDEVPVDTVHWAGHADECIFY